MANPYHHMARHTGRAKMKAIHHHHKHGGHAHADAAQDRAMIKKAISAHEHKVHGRKKGGRLDHGHRKVKISIEKSAPGGMPDTGATPSPTMMPPPGMGAGPMPAPPGPMGMQKRGGRVKHRKRGGRIHKDDGGSIGEGKTQRSQQLEQAQPMTTYSDMLNTPLRKAGGRIKPQHESVLDTKQQRHFLKMRKHGGKVYTEGESTASNLKDWAGYAGKNSFKGRATGGRIGKYPLHKGGAGSGEGRLALTRAEKKTYP